MRQTYSEYHDPDERSKHFHVYLPRHDIPVAVAKVAPRSGRTNGVTVLLP